MDKDYIDIKMAEWQRDNELVIHWRGRVIEAVVGLELAMNVYMSTFFCGHDANKGHALITYILGDDRMSFRNKLEVFTDIAKKYDTKWHDAYQGEKNLKNDLIDIVEKRNIFAHRIMDRENFSDVHAKPGTLRFLVFKNDVNSRDYSIEDCEKLIKKINNIAKFIHDRVLMASVDSAGDDSSEPLKAV